MKITIAYIDGEAGEAVAIQQFIDRLLGGVKVRKSDRHPPYKHIYIASKMPSNGSDSGNFY